MNTTRTGAWTALLVAGLASAQSPPATTTAEAEPQSSIPFTQYRSIRDWQADKRDGIWIQDARRQWHYAKFLGPCFGLDFAWSIAFDARPNGTLDRFSAIFVPGEGRCQFTSLTRSKAPPPKPRKPRKDTKAAEPAGPAP